VAKKENLKRKDIDPVTEEPRENPGRTGVVAIAEATVHKQWEETKSQEPKPTKQRITNSSLLNSRFLKSRSLLQVPFVSFYREANELFTCREDPRVKRIKTECARLFPGSLQLGLHVISASWCHAANRGAFLVVITCACREKPFDLLEIPLLPRTFRYLKHGITFKLEIIRC
jgi:hypothetical protein